MPRGACGGRVWRRMTVVYALDRASVPAERFAAGLLRRTIQERIPRPAGCALERSTLARIRQADNLYRLGPLRVRGWIAYGFTILTRLALAADRAKLAAAVERSATRLRVALGR